MQIIKSWSSKIKEVFAPQPEEEPTPQQLVLRRLEGRSAAVGILSASLFTNQEKLQQSRRDVNDTITEAISLGIPQQLAQEASEAAEWMGVVMAMSTYPDP